MRRISEWRQLLIGMSIRRYLPPIGTAGFDRECVSGKERRAPPATQDDRQHVAHGRQDMRGRRRPASSRLRRRRFCAIRRRRGDPAVTCGPVRWIVRCSGSDRRGGDAVALTISTIVCAYNEADYLGPCLQSLRRQTRPPDEILVVNNASTDGTGRDGGGGRWRPRRSTSRARGSCVRARPGAWPRPGDLLVYLDADCRAPLTWLRASRTAIRRGVRRSSRSPGRTGSTTGTGGAAC